MLHPTLLVILFGLQSNAQESTAAAQGNECLVRKLNLADRNLLPICTPSLSRDGWLAIHGATRNLFLLNPFDGEEGKLKNGSQFTAVAFGASHDIVYAGDSEGNIIRWDVALKKTQILFRLEGGAVNALFVSSNGRLLLARGQRFVCFWDLNGNKEAFRFPKAARAFVIAPDGKRAVLATSDRVLSLDTSSFKEQWSKPVSGVGTAKFVGYSPDARFLLVGEQSWGGATIRILDPADGGAARPSIVAPTLNPSLQNDGRIPPFPKAEFSRGGLLLAWAFDKPEFEIWEMATMRRAYRVLAKRDTMSGIIFSSSTQFVTTTSDGEISCWDLARTSAYMQFRDPGGVRKEMVWDRLKSLDPLQGVAATDYFCANPKEFIVMARDPSLIPPPPAKDRVSSLVKMLDNSAFLTREKAQAELVGYGELVESSLKEALHSKLSLEARSRVDSILSGIPKAAGMGPYVHRQLRAAVILEKIGSPDSVAILEQLKRDAPNQTVRERANQAILRLASNQKLSFPCFLGFIGWSGPAKDKAAPKAKPATSDK